jgi:predicted RNA-binding Zn ribbon-like protein
MTAKGEAVREALDALFSDTKVTPQVTLDDLNEILSDVENKIAVLEAESSAVRRDPKNRKTKK